MSDFSERLELLFDRADDVHDTIWYNHFTTLFEEIVFLHEEIVRGRQHDRY